MKTFTVIAVLVTISLFILPSILASTCEVKKGTTYALIPFYGYFRCEGSTELYRGLQNIELALEPDPLSNIRGYRFRNSNRLCQEEGQK